MVQEPGKEPGIDKELNGLKDLSEIQRMVVGTIKELEGRLIKGFTEAITSLNARIDQNQEEVVAMKTAATAAMASVPEKIKERVGESFEANMAGILEKVNQIFDDRAEKLMKERGGQVTEGGGGGGGGLTLNSLLQNSDKLVGLVNAFRAPTTDQAIAGQMQNMYKWFNLFSKLEKGGGSADELTQAIASTFDKGS